MHAILGGPSTRITYHSFVQNSEDVACQDFKLKDMGWEDVEFFLLGAYNKFLGRNE